CFFFSSRRRHTRFSRDWSSDVCSSDLQVAVAQGDTCPDQATILGAAADRLAIEPGTVVADLQHDFRTLTAHRDADRAFLALASFATSLWCFDTVRDRVAQHVFQRRGHALEHVAVEFALR